MEIFDRKYHEISFKELTSLKQNSTPEAYMLEFQNITMIVSHISMGLLVALYTYGFVEPLKRLGKAHKTTTLKDAINLRRDFQNMFPRTYPLKPNFPSQFK